MITAGIDVGIETVKAVVLKDGKVISKGAIAAGGAKRSEAVEQVWNEVLKSAGLKATDIEKVVATGQGKYDVKFTNDRVVEPVADARAARFLYPEARVVLDAGADQVRAVSMDGKGNILEVVLNQKCAAGLGLFLKAMARTLGLTIEEMSRLPAEAPPPALVNDGCCVFGELDAIAMIHNNRPKAEIVRAVDEAVATRINSILNDKIKPEKSATVLMGGISRNAGVIGALKRRSGINFLIPENAQFGGALGAALIAAG